MKKLFVGAAIVAAGLSSAKGIVVPNSKIATEINANAAFVNTLMQNEKIVKLNNNTLSQEQLRTVVEYTVSNLKSNQMVLQIDCASVGKIVKAVVSMMFPETNQQTLDLIVSIVTVICQVMQP